MKREFSAGGIVLRQAQDYNIKNKVEVLITQHSSYHHWSFPKGHIEEGQTIEEAALREVKEEGGIEAEIIGKVDYSKYPYTHPETKERIFKIVTYFLMKYKSGDPANHDWEVSEAKFVTPEEALKTLSFSQDKIHLKKAILMIEKELKK